MAGAPGAMVDLHAIFNDITKSQHRIEAACRGIQQAEAQFSDNLLHELFQTLAKGDEARNIACCYLLDYVFANADGPFCQALRQNMPILYGLALPDKPAFKSHNKLKKLYDRWVKKNWIPEAEAALTDMAPAVAYRRTQKLLHSTPTSIAHARVVANEVPVTSPEHPTTLQLRNLYRNRNTIQSPNPNPSNPSNLGNPSNKRSHNKRTALPNFLWRPLTLAGDWLTLERTVSDDWYEGTNLRTGARGIYPVAYVEQTQLAPPPQAPPAHHPPAGFGAPFPPPGVWAAGAPGHAGPPANANFPPPHNAGTNYPPPTNAGFQPSFYPPHNQFAAPPSQFAQPPFPAHQHQAQQPFPPPQGMHPQSLPVHVPQNQPEAQVQVQAQPQGPALVPQPGPQPSNQLQTQSQVPRHSTTHALPSKRAASSDRGGSRPAKQPARDDEMAPNDPNASMSAKLTYQRRLADRPEELPYQIGLPSPLVEVPTKISAPPTVFIWDLDETLVVFNELTNGRFARAYSLDVNTGKYTGRALEKLVFRVLDNKLFFKKLEKMSECMLESRLLLQVSSLIMGWLDRARTGADLRVARCLRECKAIYTKFQELRAQPTHRAIADLKKTIPQGLDLRQGEKLYALEEPEGGWVLARREDGSEQGLAPTTYLEAINGIQKAFQELKVLDEDDEYEAIDNILADVKYVCLRVAVRTYTEDWCDVARRALEACVRSPKNKPASTVSNTSPVGLTNASSSARQLNNAL
ncbi:uncharacterized protein MONBRDRAFT_29484 [Monosiga brevicollis MX1]|uniref:protein-tyrosine-phosphatase n=1 Tax=Monosiga brevicollis TaxID=81824 RepID=A9VB82_MONBE|nr:uncharacterized protein MONBRDRAFT_29484 [Monosiga brevicollis MX1]EDQ85192.1 predicted protein [Monosiga brevicollis MX1]|eukprot:XP_001750017.1 hypothetical protein [Monosiga brevicollis MX1]